VVGAVNRPSSMSAADIALRYLELTNRGNVDGAQALEHADIRFWLSGRLVVSGALSAAQHRKAAAAVHDTFPAGYTVHVKSVTEQGGRVAIEATGDGVLPDGRRYAPDYAFFFEVVDGRIVSMHEYIDTEYVSATFGVPVRR
jgi:ketosteroid isomerase-like protein